VAWQNPWPAALSQREEHASCGNATATGCWRCGDSMAAADGVVEYETFANV
jgi:hypothetical protein